MNTSSSQLPPYLEVKLLARLRELTSAEKIQQMLDLNQFVKETQMVAIRSAHPDADEFEIKMRVASRWVKNPELLKAAFGWDVSEKGY